MTVLNLNGRLLTFEQPRIMGIINATSDSFYSGSRVSSVKEAIISAKQMVEEEVDILDIGASSSRPGATEKSPEEEWKVLKPIIREIKLQFPEVPLSVDTYHGTVAYNALQAGADIINDISAYEIDATMLDVISESKAPYILMHMQGTPRKMQERPVYDDVVGEVLQFFIKKLRQLRSRDLTDIVLDPGFGFGKTLEHNYEMFRKLSVFKILECPLVVGVSRKSMIYRLLNITPEESLAPSTALHLQALLKGANILRVHDVREAVQAVELYKKLR